MHGLDQQSAQFALDHSTRFDLAKTPLRRFDPAWMHVMHVKIGFGVPDRGCSFSHLRPGVT